MSKKINKARAAAGLAKFCEVQISSSNPTLYDWIGISTNSNKVSAIRNEEIAEAIRRAISKLKNTPAAQRDSDWQDAAQVIQLAKSKLLNASARKKYDAQLKELGTADQPPSNQSNPSRNFLDAESADLDSSIRSKEASNRQFASERLPTIDPNEADRLRELIQSKLQTSLTQSKPNSPTEQFLAVVNDSQMIDVELVSEPQLLDTESINTTAAVSLGSLANPNSVTATRRQKRKNSHVRVLMTVVGLLVSVLFVAGTGYFLLNGGIDLLNTAQERPEDIKVRIANSDSNSTTAEKQLVSPLADLLQNESDENDVNQIQSPLLDSNESITDRSPGEMAAAPTDTAPNENGPNKIVAGNDLAESPDVLEPLTEDEIEMAWSLMEQARTAVLQKDFDLFDQQIEAAGKLARNEALKEKFDRLNQFGQLYQIFSESIEESINRLPTAGVIQAGNTEMSFVSADGNQLTFRIGGKNQSFEKESLPLGITLALTEMSLDQNADVDVGAKWVYLLIRGKRDFNARRRAKKIAAELENSDSIIPTLDEVLTDTYP